MIDSVVQIKHNIKIGEFFLAIAFLISKSKEYQPKKSLVLTEQQVSSFLSNAPDSEHLDVKVNMKTIIKSESKN